MASTTKTKSTKPKKADSETIDKWLETFALFIHDLESPLASVKYLLKIIEEGRFDFDKKRHQSLVHSSSIAINRAESIIYDIMAIARSGKAGLPVNLVELDPGPIISEAIALCQGSAQENELTIEYQEPKKSQSVIADPSLLERTLDNLLYNAIRHTPSGGRIEISVENQTESLFINIKDSGPGLGDIDPDTLFEKYGQVKLRSENKHRGVGLGLYFCKLAATGMGGTVIATDHLDGGAVFSIRLRKVKE